MVGAFFLPPSARQFLSFFFLLFSDFLSLSVVMVKLGFSVSVLSVFAIFSLVSTSLAAVHRRTELNTASVSNNTSASPCTLECALPQTVLNVTCAGVGGLSGVPCGCTDAYSIAQQTCSRCRLPYAGSKAQLEMNTFNEKKNFGGESRPIIFTFETPLSTSDDSFPDYISAVCLKVSQCFIGGTNWGRCPNSDVSGILVRVSAYMANLLLGIVLMYSPAESSTAVWTQLLTVYSLLISAIIAIANTNMSRFHSEMTVFLVMSPLSSTLVVYAILGFCGRSHRLDTILSQRREHLLPRLLVIAFAIISLSLVFFSGLANVDHFAANPCEVDSVYRTAGAILANLLFIPYAGVALIVIELTTTRGADGATIAGIFLLLAPFLVVFVSFLYALVAQRHVFPKQYKLQNKRWRIWVMWDVVAEQYPLLHFCGVFFIPMAYWILFNEIRTFGTPDNIFSSSFGQILALFVVLPPLLQVIQMVPAAGAWFVNLTFVRLITRRRRQFVPLVRASSLEDGVMEKDPSVVDPFTDPEPSRVHTVTGPPQRF
ncbi:hypothetical protein DFH09DRAFT_1141209 [Mycena vulgaris]|nr:hypothetical protein DFH09DRAFT_1141209 [Mycena vulgaris]